MSLDQTEYQINDRISFMRFLDLELENTVPDAKTIWNYQNTLANNKARRQLFDLFFAQLLKKGYITRAGSIVDASFIEAPKRKNTDEQREALKKGDIPKEWNAPEHPQKLLQRDIDATWTVKNREAHFGYKDTVKVDLDSKLITDYRTTPSSTNDARAAERIFTKEDNVAYEDAAYPFMDLPENVESKICAGPTKNHPLSEEQKKANHQKAKKRCQLEHVFAGMVQMVGGTSLRCKSLVRAEFNRALLNMIYNMCRVISLNALQKG